MLEDLLGSPAGTYVVALLLGIGVGLGLSSAERSRVAWIGSLIITGVFVVLTVTVLPSTILAVPVYVVVMSMTVVVSSTERYADSPLLLDEPFWRRVVLTLTHERAIRQAALTLRADVRDTADRADPRKP